MVSPANLVLGSVLRAHQTVHPEPFDSVQDRPVEGYFDNLSTNGDTFQIEEPADDNQREVLMMAGSMGGAMDPRCREIEVGLFYARVAIIGSLSFASAAVFQGRKASIKNDMKDKQFFTLASIYFVGMAAIGIVVEYFESKFYDENCRPPSKKREIPEGLELAPIPTRHRRVITDLPLEQGFAQEAIIFAPFIAIGALAPIAAAFLAGAIETAIGFFSANASATASTAALAPVVINSLQDQEQKAKSR